jgi:hypothetical protein
LQVYRRDGDVLKLAAMVGGRNPWPDGTYDDKQPPEKRKPLGQWTWTDANNDGTVQEGEVVWFAPPGKGQYATFGIMIAALVVIGVRISRSIVKRDRARDEALGLND